MASWKDLLASADSARTIQRAKSTLGKGVVYDLGSGGYDPTQPISHQCDCSGFVAWSIGIPRELPPGSGRWLDTDAYYAGGGSAGQGLFDRVPPGQAAPGDIYVYPDSGGRQGHIGLITDVSNGTPTKVIHCAAHTPAIRITDPGVFARHAGRVMRVDYEALRYLFGIEAPQRGRRLILAKPTGEADEPFAYKCFTSARFVADHFEISPTSVAQWLGRTDSRSQPMPIRAILDGWGLQYSVNLDHQDDGDDPRVYIFLESA